MASNNSVVCYTRIEISKNISTWTNKIRLVLTDISSLKSISSKSRYSGASIILLWTFWVSQHSSKDLIKKKRNWLSTEEPKITQKWFNIVAKLLKMFNLYSQVFHNLTLKAKCNLPSLLCIPWRSLFKI